jgi:hypothetical protein
VAIVLLAGGVMVWFLLFGISFLNSFSVSFLRRIVNLGLLLALFSQTIRNDLPLFF